MINDSQFYRRILDYLLIAIALLLLLSLGLKAVFDIDRNFDTWAYHLPFAARLWGIIPDGAYQLDSYWLPRYQGFGLLGEYLQGFFWWITGRPESANLVAYLSLPTYFFFLKKYFNVPFYLSAIGLLAIPLVQIHATAAYIDLPSAMAMAVLIMMTYRMYLSSAPIKTTDLLILFVAAAMAANMRLQFVPLVFAVLCFAAYPLWKSWTETKRQAGGLAMVVLLLALTVIFATPIKNLLLHGNPVYPVIVKIAGIELNHTETPPLEPELPGYGLARPMLWAYSVFETIPKPYFDAWTIGGGQKTVGDQFGGFFGAYVLFNILILAYLSYANWSRQTKAAVCLMILMSIMTAFMPSSPRLRYYMFWMIVLVSLNFYLIGSLANSASLAKWLNSRNIGLVSGLFLGVVIFNTHGVYARPFFYPFHEYYQKHVDFNLLKKIQDGDNICINIPHEHQHWLFLYSSAFHEPLNYSIKAGNSVEQCGAWKMLEEVKVGT